MQLIDRDSWQKGLENNADGRIDDYGGCVYWFAETWANLMEAAMANGSSLESCAETCEKGAMDAMGRYSLTGYQYGTAVSILAATWEHGDELRRHHNIKHQIQNEGEQANKSGGILNPAIINLNAGLNL